MDDDDFKKLINDPETNPQEVLNSYAAAFRQEFEEAQKDSPDNVEQAVLDFFKKNLSSAMAQMVWLSNNASSENVRFSASKFVIEEARSDSTKAGDPITEILNQLTKKSTTPTAKDPVPAD